jgi:hypothetical protein
LLSFLIHRTSVVVRIALTIMRDILRPGKAEMQAGFCCKRETAGSRFHRCTDRSNLVGCALYNGSVTI